MKFSDRAVTENNDRATKKPPCVFELDEEITSFAFFYKYEKHLEYDGHFLSKSKQLLMQNFATSRADLNQSVNRNFRLYETTNSVFRTHEPLVFADIDYTYSFVEKAYRKILDSQYFPAGKKDYKDGVQRLTLSFPVYFVEVGNGCYGDYLLYRLKTSLGYRICPTANYDNYNNTLDVENLYLADMSGNIIDNFEEVVEYINFKRMTYIYIAANNENKLDLYDSEIVDSNLLFMNVYLSAKLLCTGGCAIFAVDDYSFLFTRIAGDILQLLVQIFESIHLYKPVNAYKSQVFILGFHKKRLINDIYTSLDLIAIQTKKQNARGNYIGSLFKERDPTISDKLETFISDQMEYEVVLRGLHSNAERVNLNAVFGDLGLLGKWGLPSAVETKLTINTMRDLIDLSDYLKDETDDEEYPFSFPEFRDFDVEVYAASDLNVAAVSEIELLDEFVLNSDIDSKKTVLELQNWVYRENSFYPKRKGGEFGISGEVSLNGRVAKRFVENNGIESLFRTLQLYKYFSLNQLKTVKYEQNIPKFELQSHNYVEAFATPFSTSEKFCSYFSSDKETTSSLGVFFSQFPALSATEHKWFLFPPASRAVYDKIHSIFLETSRSWSGGMSIKIVLYRSFLHGTSLLENLEKMLVENTAIRKKIDNIYYYDMKEGRNVIQKSHPHHGKLYEYEISSYE